MAPLLNTIAEVEPFVIHNATAVISTLDGVTTALVAFLLACLFYPALIKHRAQYYAAMAAIVAMILLHAASLMLHDSSGFLVMAGVFTGVLQVAALLMLVLSVGGISPRELAGEMARAYEVMRRGETEKEVIIPIGKKRGNASEAAPGTVYHVDASGSTVEVDGASKSGGSLPME